MSNEEVLDRLRKLYRLKESAEKIGSLAEAENAAARIQEILLKYNLEMSDADLNKVEHGMNDVEIEYLGKKVEGRWITSLYSVLAVNNFCRSVNTVVGNEVKKITILGRKHNIEVVIYLGNYLTTVFRELARKSFREYENEGMGDSKRNAYIRAFLSGAVSGLNERLRREKAAQENKEQVYALVKREDAAVIQYMNDKFKNLHNSSKVTKRSAYDGYQNGKIAGNSVSLHKGMNSGMQRNMLNG